MITKGKLGALVTFVLALFALVACSAGVDDTGEEVGSVRLAAEVCTLGVPVITEVREENPGPVAPGITKIYHVQVRNANSAACAPATITFVPDSFMFFGIVVEPRTISGVASGTTANFRVAVTSDPSLPEGVTDIGFTIIVNNPTTGATTARGSLRYEINLTNPVGCNRQIPQVEVQIVSPTPVPLGGTINYRVTVRNVDNRECGQDTFFVNTSNPRFFTISTTPLQLAIPAASSGVFNISLTSVVGSPLPSPSVQNIGIFLLGQRHQGNLVGQGTLRYEIR